MLLTRDLKSWPRPPTLPPVLRSGAQSQLSGTAATESMAAGNWARPGYKTAPSASDFCTCVGFEGDLQLSQTCFYHLAERVDHLCYHHILMYYGYYALEFQLNQFSNRAKKFSNSSIAVFFLSLKIATTLLNMIF